MKKLLLLFIVFVLFSCKTDQEKLEQKVKNNIETYVGYLSQNAKLDISNIVITKIDSISTYREMEILNNILQAEFNRKYEDKADIGIQLEKSENSLKLSEQINQTSNFQSVVDNNRSERNNLKTEFEKLNAEAWSINDKMNILLTKSTRANKKDLKAFVANVKYTVKYKDSSIEPIEKLFFLSKDGEVYNEEVYIKNLKAEYLK